MAFQTTTGANGVVSLVGTSGVDADFSIIIPQNVYIDAKEDNDIMFVTNLAGAQNVSGYTVKGGQGGDLIEFNTALVNSTIWGDVINEDGTVGSGDDRINLEIVQNSTILGLGGADEIYADDLSTVDLNGNQGNDLITINSTFDGAFARIGDVQDVINSFVRAGQDNDRIGIFVNDLINTHINGNKGTDLIVVDVNAGGVINTSTIYGGQGDDNITASAVDNLARTAAGFVISGDLGNDIITASARRDTIEGGDGNDTITGSGNADSMTGGAGTNRFFQGVNDSRAATGVQAGVSISYANGVDVITDFKSGGTGGDNLTFTGDAAAALTIERGNFVNNVFTLSATGGDRLLFTSAGGPDGNDIILLNQGNVTNADLTARVTLAA